MNLISLLNNSIFFEIKLIIDFIFQNIFKKINDKKLYFNE